MPRGRGNLGRGGGRARRGGRVWKPRSARHLSFPISASGIGEAVEPIPGPSTEPSRPSLMDSLKMYKAAKAVDAKNVANLSPADKKRLEELRQRKQVGNFIMPDAPQPKKGKGKGKGKGRQAERQETRIWSPCPLLPGVPTVPPPHVPQRWELKCSDDITEEEEEDVTYYELSADTPPTMTAAESVMDIDATEATSSSPPVIVIPGCSTAETSKTTPQKKNRQIHAIFSPSAGIVQSTVAPENIVPAEIEFLGFTPSSTTSTAAPGSGGSTYEFDIDIDFECDFIEPGEGSDVDKEEYLPDISLSRNVADSLEPLVSSSLVEALETIDAEADAALRTVLDHGPDQDLLSFDWRCDPEYFQGAREAFTVASPGPTFKTVDLSPLEVFLKIWDADLIAHIVQETNRYGEALVRRNKKPESRLQRWKNVTDGEIRSFFAIIMLQSLVANNVEREYWYPKLSELRVGNFGDIMPFNPFLAIKRCLHFVDNASLPEHPNRLDKIMPIIESLNNKFSSLYLLEQNIAIDESLLLWKGRLSFSQKIATKKARVGIKSYELCESRTGYLWRMEVYSGKGHVHGAQVGLQEPVEKPEEGVEPEGATSQIVLTLMRPLFNRGHTLVMDNFYNSPLLSRILKVKHKTDSMGTLRLNREFVPEGLKKKAKHNMKAGEVAFSSTKDLSVVVWKDKNVVSMISTYHDVKVGGIEKYGNYKYKPQVILDYNLSMGGIDHKDQMLQAYPIERIRNSIWYKKLFRRLLNVSIHNAFVMFNHNRTQVLGHRDFRLQLVKELLQTCRPLALPRSLAPVPAAPSQMHLPAKNERPQRCKLCHAAKVRRSTMWRCSTCAVNLCIERCYTDYHTSSHFMQD